MEVHSVSQNALAGTRAHMHWLPADVLKGGHLLICTVMMGIDNVGLHASVEDLRYAASKPQTRRADVGVESDALSVIEAHPR